MVCRCCDTPLTPSGSGSTKLVKISRSTHCRRASSTRRWVGLWVGSWVGSWVGRAAVVVGGLAVVMGTLLQPFYV